MAYITPNTTVKLLVGVPFDADYENTGYFASKADQETFMNTKVLHTLSSYYYQREGIDIIKVQLTYAQCYQVNYMMFKNTSYENKWYYAFVTEIEYISDTVTALHYKLDVMQTWLTDYQLEECFIDRQHSVTDGIGDNITPESVDVGEQVYNDYQELSTGQTYGIHDLYAVVCICDVNEATVRGSEVQNVYSGAVMYAFDVQDANELADLNQFLATYIQRPDAVVGLYMCPKCMIVRSENSGGTQWSYYFVLNSGNSPLYRINLPTLTASGNTLNGYAPRNMKMFTYPYNYLSIDNAMGKGLSLRYEYFGMGITGQNKLTPMLILDGSGVQPVQLRVRPANYKGSGGSWQNTLSGSVFFGNPINSEFCTVENYPMCSWNFDSYKAWLAQGLTVAGAKIGSNVVGMGIPRNVRGNYQMNMNQVANTWGSVTNALIENYQASIAADQFRGSLEMGNVNVAQDMAGFWYGRVSCNAITARRIDDYFTMFGYNQGIVATPNRHARTRFTYVKTIGCELGGNLPDDDKVKIKTIFNNGVRFWADVTHVGNYLLANPVIT